MQLDFTEFFVNISGYIIIPTQHIYIINASEVRNDFNMNTPLAACYYARSDRVFLPDNSYHFLMEFLICSSSDISNYLRTVSTYVRVYHYFMHRQTDRQTLPSKIKT